MAYASLSQREAIAQISVLDNQTASALAQKLAGTGITIQNATLACPAIANGIFNVTSSNLGLDSGIVLTTGRAKTTGTSSSQTGVNGAQSLASNDNGAVGDPALNILANTTTHDACILQFDIVPVGDTVRFNYVFGSEEYTNSTCGPYNDAFAFFISGPGIAGTDNMALVPGTNIPVTVNSVNNGIPGSGAGTNISNCTSLGPGSPFTSYYIDNAGGTTLTYKGLTTVLSAIHAVTACNTYHLKLTIADGENYLYDSGVFIEAGSLKTTSYSVMSTGNGNSTIPYAVKGCAPGQIIFTSTQTKSTPQVVKFTLGGTAVNGIDYASIPDSVIIPANSNTVTLPVQGLVTPQNGATTLMLYVYSPYNCTGTSTIIDSTELLIYDAPYVHILSNDTAVCQNIPFQIHAVGDTLLQYNWTPTPGLNNPGILEPIVMPDTTTTYTITGTMVGCMPVSDQFTVTIQHSMQVDAGPDKTVCVGTPLQFNVNVTPSNQTYTYSWLPGTYLNDSTIPDPISNPQSDITYIVKVQSATCFAFDTVNVHVLPNDFMLYNHDTAICAGASVQVNALGDAAFTYLWTPATGVSNTGITNPLITADSSQTYYLTANYPGCTNIVHTLSIDVQPYPLVLLGGDRSLCEFDTLQFNAVVIPATYTHYIYNWAPAANLNNSYTPNVVYTGDTSATLYLTVTTPAGCMGMDLSHITVHGVHFASVIPANDTNICPHDSVQFMASGGISYQWTPSDFINNTSIANPVAHPEAGQLYTVYVTDNYGCRDTLNINVVVHPAAVLNLGDSVTLYPGETYQMNAQGNCLNYLWFPPLGLSATDISNPVASPEVNTKYIVHATTEWGCAVVDSINVFVDPNTLLAIPNAFTPGNGPNNELKIIKRGVATLKYIRIFNRWGNKVFETTNIDDGWDGKYNGAPQPLGVYVYEVEAETNTGSRFYKQGNVLLLR